ncbi:membrane metallo-endopeptidase-like 1 [Dermacentor albipictus]|uniref:membrane metallo-endopeptidase-like 1 n=1 Tax=Dermacentor albipictus TaxID=60249 RepID=UPI0031FC2E73
MKKFTNMYSGRGATDSASAVPDDTITPTLQAPSESSNVGRATTGPSAPTIPALAGRSRRRRNTSSSTSSSASQAHIAVPSKETKHSSSSSRTMSTRSETAEPVPLTHGIQSSTAASVSPRPKEELASPPRKAHQATSRTGRRRTDELTGEGRKARRRQESSVESSKLLPATATSQESRPDDTGTECSAEKSNLPGTNVGNQPLSEKSPVGIRLRTEVGSLSPSMVQLNDPAMNRDFNLEAGSIMRRPDTVVPGPAATPKKRSQSIAAVNSKRKLQIALGTGTGVSTNIQDLLELKKPTLDKQSLWQNLHAVVREGPLQQRRTFIFMLLLCAAAGSLLLGLLMYGIFSADNPSAVKVCGNNDCVDHVATLSLAGNENIVSPCQNFAQFVCSGVKNKYSFLAKSVVEQMILGQTDQIIRRHVTRSVFRRPSQMIRRCMDSNTRDESTLKFFLDFLRNKSFAWPTPNEADAFPDANSKNYSQPLKILLDLAVKWAMPIWFRCDLLFRRERTDRAVRLAPSPMGRVAKKFQDFVVSTNLYNTYTQFIANIIFSLRKPTPAFASFVKRSRSMQENIYNKLSVTLRNSVPKKVLLRDMPSFVRGLTVNDWQRVLQTVYNVHPPITGNDVVFVTNHRLLVVISVLFEAYTPQEIAFHVAWWFAQIACTLSSQLLFNAISGFGLGSRVHFSYCAALAKGYYSILLAAVSKADTSIQDQIRINNYFKNVKTVALEKLGSTKNIENLTNNKFQSMLMQTETVLWPSGSLASPEGLKLHYGPALNGSNGLIGEVLETVRFQQRFIGTYEASVAAKIFFYTGTSLTSYDPVQNVISVATDLLGPPFYYSSGTSAMIYGGLGFFYAMEVVSALNSMGALIRDNSTSTRTQSLNASLWVPSTCDNHDLLFPELPALALAHAAYLRFRDANSDLPLKGLSYSPDQIFFISFCHATCLFYPNNTHFSPACNEAVKNFAPFSRAFSCPKGSEMNPATKCQYF